MTKTIKMAMLENAIRIKTPSGGELAIPCAVLEDGTRVLSQRGLYKSFGGAKTPTSRGVDTLPYLLRANNLKPFITDELAASSMAIPYRSQFGGGTALGVLASVLPQICDVWLKARDAGVLLDQQKHFAIQAEILMRGFAHVGIIALVDEATGYQDMRTKKALAEILERYIAEEWAKWVKTFPDEFYKLMFKLNRWPYNEHSQKGPLYAGKLVVDVVYKRLAPGVREELEKKNPRLSAGYRKHKYFQWLTDDYGIPKLREHLAAVIALMRVAPDWRKFMDMLNRALPKQGPLPLLDWAEGQKSKKVQIEKQDEGREN